VRASAGRLVSRRLSRDRRCSDDDDSSKPKTSGGSTSSADTTTSEEPDAGPAELFQNVVRQESLGQYGRAWDRLHPAHQKIAPRSFFDGCFRETGGFGGELEVTVIEVYDDPIDIPAIPETSKAVTYRIRQQGTDATETATSHAVDVDGEWRWVLAPQQVPCYRSGECPP
jgi:hypothetical protein